MSSARDDRIDHCIRTIALQIVTAAGNALGCARPEQAQFVTPRHLLERAGLDAGEPSRTSRRAGTRDDIVYSFVHVVAPRHAAYAALGSRYDFGDWPLQVVYDT